ncbi:UNVERIFIED_CONTAM: Retrovirus-related Pol polyprotein from transposon RE2 [Sesamum latifolium]|uniref:Retrovirus-related Pol polyprotein from transposon RE2 n=1 Tax=Sesamum latifolium TaxID=2727402 RepID=A0AAW2YBZ7_9LAMI
MDNVILLLRWAHYLWSPIGNQEHFTGSYIQSDKPAVQNSNSMSPQIETFQPRRSTRLTSKPTWLNDFDCSFSTSTKLVQDISVAPSYRCFVDCLSVLQEPSTFTEAQQNDEWRKAMQSEVEALERNGTWELVQAPTDKKTIGCRWIYKLKLKPDGTVERYKARLVAKGYSQVEGEDYTDCFAPVAKAVTVRLFLAVAVSKGWPIHHLDVNNAFLHGSLKEDIYMDPPEGYEGNAKYFRGIELARSSQGLLATQTKYVSDIIKDAGLIQAKATNIPLPVGVKLTSDCGSLLTDPSKYRGLVGRILYLSFTRPDVSHAAQQLSQYLQHPCQLHWDAAVHLDDWTPEDP